MPYAIRCEGVITVPEDLPPRFDNLDLSAFPTPCSAGNLSPSRTTQSPRTLTVGPPGESPGAPQPPCPAPGGENQLQNTFHPPGTHHRRTQAIPINDHQLTRLGARCASSMEPQGAPGGSSSCSVPSGADDSSRQGGAPRDPSKAPLLSGVQATLGDRHSQTVMG